ncbi:hypothetical protein BGX26_006830, partial [Mortierella sp. AD094]
RCRNLKELKMISLGPKTFAWATEENLNLTRWNLLEMNNSLVATLPDFIHRPPTQPLYPLVPLEHLHLRSYWTPVTNEINDIVSAFPETLVTLIVQDATPLANTTLIEHGPLTVEFGGRVCSKVPYKLRKVIIVLPRQEVVFPDHLLAAYRELEYLEIEDGLSIYTCDSTLLIANSLGWNKAHADALAIKTIKLQGRSALCFHPECLYRTPDLRLLYLGTKVADGQSYIPPVAEILRYEYDSKDQEALDFKAKVDYYYNRGFAEVAGDHSVIPEEPALKRPYWSWDWSLPNLETLHLTGEFAWRFKFNMLAGCPSLESLSLNMATIGDNNMVTESEEGDGYRQDGELHATQQDQLTFEHQRYIQAQDFLSPTGGNDICNSGAYLQTLRLKYLYIRGRWLLSDETLHVMLLSVMPNLQTLTESQCLGFTIGAWIRVTSQLASLKTASSTRIVKEERLAEMGLEKYVQGLDRTPRFIVVEENINGGVRRKFVAVPDGGHDAKDDSGQPPKLIYTFIHGGEYFKVA